MDLLLAIPRQTSLKLMPPLPSTSMISNNLLAQGFPSRTNTVWENFRNYFTMIKLFSFLPFCFTGLKPTCMDIYIHLNIRSMNMYIHTLHPIYTCIVTKHKYMYKYILPYVNMYIIHTIKLHITYIYTYTNAYIHTKHTKINYILYICIHIHIHINT